MTTRQLASVHSGDGFHWVGDGFYVTQLLPGSPARFALDDVRDQGTRKVLPICPFIKGWIGKHPDYIPLVYGTPTSTATD